MKIHMIKECLLKVVNQFLEQAAKLSALSQTL